MNDKHYMFIKVKVLVELSQNFWKWLNQEFFFNKAEISYFILHIYIDRIPLFFFLSFFLFSIHLQKLKKKIIFNGSWIVRLPGVLKIVCKN